MSDSIEDAKSLRGRLLHVYQAALAAVEGRKRVRAALAGRRPPRPVRAVAVGKAASAMLSGAFDALGADIEAALLITKHGYGPAAGALPRTECIEAGHPVPDGRSLRAGAALLRFIADAPPGGAWLMLISGGASSLVEVLPEGRGLADLQRMNERLLAGGFAIDGLNAVRRRLSRIKGGGLALHLARHGAGRVLALLMSDVPDDDPGVIGSGLLHAPPTLETPPALPAWLGSWLEDAAPPPADAAVLPAIETVIVASLDLALAAAARAGAELGLDVHRHPKRLAGDAAATGRCLARTLLAAPPGLHLWGGETTVVLPAAAGYGGRCQQLALASAEVLDGCADCALLAGATDGSDGPTDVAGALVDGSTVPRGRSAGLDAARALAAADAGSYLAATGDLIDTGPTGSNVNDVVLALKLGAGV